MKYREFNITTGNPEFVGRRRGTYKATVQLMDLEPVEFFGTYDLGPSAMISQTVESLIRSKLKVLVDYEETDQPPAPSSPGDE